MASLLQSIRQLVPSVSRLTFNPAFKAMVNTSDLPWRLLVPEFADLPPNHLRIRVGVGNRFFNNQAFYLTAGASFWIKAAFQYGLTKDSTIVDMGSGCGRYGHILRDADLNGRLFGGRYIGVDIDAEAIEWCRAHFDERFTFHQSSNCSASYNREGTDAPYIVPEPSGIADLVFSASLFTHLLEEEAENYLRETARLLKPGGVTHHTFFCLDRPPRSLGSRYRFSHTKGRASIESLRQPEAAVAYTSSDMIAMALAAGLVNPRIEHRVDDEQAFLISYAKEDGRADTPLDDYVRTASKDPLATRQSR